MAINHEEIFQGWLFCTWFEAKLYKLVYVEHLPTISKQYATMLYAILIEDVATHIPTGVWAGLIMYYNFMYIKKKQKQVSIIKFLKRNLTCVGMA